MSNRTKKCIACVRVSTTPQEYRRQKKEIAEYAAPRDDAVI